MRKRFEDWLENSEITTSDEEFDAIFDSIDANKSGSIEWEEFLELMSKQYDKKFTKKQVEACFKRFDLNSDGMVTTNELRIVIEKLGRTMTQKQLEDMVKAVDKDRSGGLSIEGKIHDARLDFFSLLCQIQISFSIQFIKNSKKFCHDNRQDAVDQLHCFFPQNVRELSMI